jgi:hypothetical protein
MAVGHVLFREPEWVKSQFVENCMLFVQAALVWWGQPLQLLRTPHSQRYFLVRTFYNHVLVSKIVNTQ